MSEETINDFKLQGVLEKDPKRYDFKRGPGFGYNVIISFPNVKKDSKNGTIYCETGNQEVANKLEGTRAGDHIIVRNGKINVNYWTPDSTSEDKEPKERSSKRLIMYEIAIKKGERKEPEPESSGSDENLPEGFA